MRILIIEFVFNVCLHVYPGTSSVSSVVYLSFSFFVARVSVVGSKGLSFVERNSAFCSNLEMVLSKYKVLYKKNKKKNEKAEGMEFPITKVVSRK